jgi:myo-inositol-1(or 4)-monophosphatase
MTTPELIVAREAARAGGAVVARYFREGVTMRSKDIVNLVSDADIESERAVVEVIRKTFPGHKVYAEEIHKDDVGSEHLWIIDPLDGTHNFAHQIPHFAVSIAYYRAGVAECGVILDPIRDAWYVAARGQGASFNDAPVGPAEPSRLDEVLVAFGFGYDRDGMMAATLKAAGALAREPVLGVRRFGSAALDLAMVGTGQFGAFFEYELNLWDFAAGRLFVEEAGGRVTDCRGEPLPLAHSHILATNGVMHEAVLQIVRSHIPDRDEM